MECKLRKKPLACLVMVLYDFFKILTLSYLIVRVTVRKSNAIFASWKIKKLISKMQ